MATTKESSSALKICDWVVKYSIYTIVFLIPVLFLPWTSDALDFNKQTILLLLVFVALFAWMARALLSGKFQVIQTPMHIVVGVLFLVYILATIFSVNKYGSFWGWPQITSESLLSLIALALFYFLVSNVFSKRNIFVSAIILSCSALLAEIIGVLQLFGLFIIPFDFAKTATFNTIGTMGSLGFFAAIMLPLAIILLITSKKWWRALFISEIFFSALLLFLINYSIIWWVVIAGSAAFIAFVMMKRDIFDGRWMALPMFFLAVSLFFVFFNPQINFPPQKPNEYLITQKASFNITQQALKDMPVFGSGPGTFAYDFSKYKNSDFYKSSLWNFTFNKGASKVLNDLTTTGVLGFLAVLALLALPVYYGIKFFIAKKQESAAPEEKTGQLYSALVLGLLVCLIVQGVACFLYSSNITLDFIFFFLAAGLVGLIAKEKKEYRLKSSSLTTLLVTFAFTLMFIFGLGIIILDGQRYVADVVYTKGFVNWQAGQKDGGIKDMVAAVNINSSSDLYFRQLSQVYLLRAQDELQNSSGASNALETKKIQALVANSINGAETAVTLNPQNVNNWLIRGYIYQSLFNATGDLSYESRAVASYDGALKLNPNDPYSLAQKGNVFLVAALKSTQDQAQQRSQYFSQAREQLEKAVSIKPDYSNALYSLGSVYDFLNQKDKAIEVFTKIQQLNPQNTDIKKILDSLNAGLPAPKITTPTVENPPSVGTVSNPATSSKTK